MAPWLRFLEAWMVQQLLRTPAFHRGVEKVARTVHRMRHGLPPEEMGGTRIDRPDDGNSFLRHFSEEVNTQLGRAEARVEKQAVKGSRTSNESSMGKSGQADIPEELEENADAVWKTTQKTSSEPPKEGFLGEYIGALREQLRGGK